MSNYETSDREIIRNLSLTIGGFMAVTAVLAITVVLVADKFL